MHITDRLGNFMLLREGLRKGDNKEGSKISSEYKTEALRMARVTE